VSVWHDKLPLFRLLRRSLAIRFIELFVLGKSAEKIGHDLGRKIFKTISFG